MGEGRRKKERRREPPAPKPTAKLAPLPRVSDKAVAGKQRAFCKKVVDKLLDDESSLSFSKPVDELWDREELTGYYEQIKNPMDLGTVRTRLEKEDGYLNKETGLFDPNDFRFEARLVFLNALDFNERGTPLAKLSTKFLQFIDSELSDLPGQPNSEPDESNDGLEHRPKETEKDKDTDKEKEDPLTDKVMSDKDPVEAPSGADGADGAVGAVGADGADADMNDAEQRDEEMKDTPDENGKEVARDEEEMNKLREQIGVLQKDRARSESQLAELELVKNQPLSHEETLKLRDEVEGLSWDTAKKVVKILRKYVDEALVDCSEKDPEFVTLEFSTVEPRLLRDIEGLIRPDPRVEKERKAIATLDEEIVNAQRKLKRIGWRDTSIKKKARRRR